MKNINLVPIISKDGRVSVINLQEVEIIHFRPDDAKVTLKVEYSGTKWREFSGDAAFAIWDAICEAVPGLPVAKK